MVTNNEQLSALIEDTSITLAILESDGIIRYESPAVERILGFGHGERTGTHITRWLHPDDTKEVQDIIAQSSCDLASALSRRIRIRGKNGSWNSFELAGENMLENPRIRGFVIYYRDITERIKLEEQFLQSQKMEAIGKLAGGIAHDFNNLLLAIQGYTEMALMTLDKSNPVHEDIKEIHSAALSAADLTRQLLILSQKQSIKPKVMSINKIITSLMKMFMRIIGENITIQTELEPDLWKVKADKTSMEQLLLNLVVNARDAMPRGGTITIRTENMALVEETRGDSLKSQSDTFVGLTITDTGIGMESEVLKHIFDPFYTTKETGKGTGLGLSIVYGIVARHEGYIDVASEPDEGASFSIYLPTSMQEEEDKAKKFDSTLFGLRGEGEKILVVEDDSGARKFLKKVLEKYNYAVKTAASVKEAREVFHEEKTFDLVFCDVVLPDGNGLDFAQGLLEKFPDMRLLMTSGYAEEKSQATIIDEKNIPFIRKPYPLVVLLQTIRKAIKTKESRS
jgi:two-component system, cell cycle sensor histidine kinase and response regulator CckA